MVESLTPPSALPEGTKLLPRSEVCTLLGCSQAMLRKLSLRDPTFPQAVHLTVGPHGVRWIEGELLAWVTARARARQADLEAASKRGRAMVAKRRRAARAKASAVA